MCTLHTHTHKHTHTHSHTQYAHTALQQLTLRAENKNDAAIWIEKLSQTAQWLAVKGGGAGGGGGGGAHDNERPSAMAAQPQNAAGLPQVALCAS